MANRWHLFLLWQLACCFVPYAIWWSQRAQCCYPDTGGRVEFVQDSNFSLGIKRHIKFSNFTEKSDFFSCNDFHWKKLDEERNIYYSEFKSTLYPKIILLDLPIIWMTNRNTILWAFSYQPLCSCNFVMSNLKFKSLMDSKVEAPSTGTFLVNCTSDQNGYYSTTANLTLSVTEGGGDNGNGTAVKEIISQKKIQ